MSQPTTIVGIAGASGAGKSSFARHLYQRLIGESTNGIGILNEDCYYRDGSHLDYEERSVVNYDHPDALDHDLLVEHLVRLHAGHSVEVPQYDYSLHIRKPGTTTMSSSRILILEGILILHNPLLRDLLDLKIYVDVPLDICLSRRLRRDTQERGRSLDSILSQYENTVRPMFYKYVAPSRQHADLIVPGGGHNENALQVLCNHLAGILEGRNENSC